jgi:hypothetical protein
LDNKVIFSENRSLIKDLKSLDDSTLGGSSSSKVEVIDIVDPDDKNPNVPIKVIQFDGIVKYDDEIAQRIKTRGSFCAMKAYFTKVLDLRDYEGFGLTVKSSTDLSFQFNMNCETMFQRDLFQVTLQIPANNWYTFHVPFHYFRQIRILIIISNLGLFIIHIADW